MNHVAVLACRVIIIKIDFVIALVCAAQSFQGGVDRATQPNEITYSPDARRIRSLSMNTPRASYVRRFQGFGGGDTHNDSTHYIQYSPDYNK